MSDEFVGFPKISRLMRDIVITEKLDGTNAQIYIEPRSDALVNSSIPFFSVEGPGGVSYCMVAGSRNKWITAQDDNYGFARWVSENRDELLKLGPGRHFGEWWGAGIQRRYGLAEKRFSLFNVGRWSADYAANCLGAHQPGVVEIDTKLGTLRPGPSCCYVVPTLYTGPFNMGLISAALAQLEQHGSVAAPGFMNAEGVVILHKASGTLFKRTIKNDESPKGGPQ